MNNKHTTLNCFPAIGFNLLSRWLIICITIVIGFFFLLIGYLVVRFAGWLTDLLLK